MPGNNSSPAARAASRFVRTSSRTERLRNGGSPHGLFLSVRSVFGRSHPRFRWVIGWVIARSLPWVSRGGKQLRAADRRSGGGSRARGAGAGGGSPCYGLQRLHGGYLVRLHRSTIEARDAGSRSQRTQANARSTNVEVSRGCRRAHAGGLRRGKGRDAPGRTRGHGRARPPPPPRGPGGPP